MEKLFYKVQKSKNKTLVFIHGLSGSSSAWEPYIEHFKKKYSTILLDLRGHGKSFGPSKYEDYAVGKMSEDIYRILKQEKLSDIVLISHSMGSFVALEFLNKHQNLVSSAVFINPAYSLFKRTSANILRPFFLANYLPQKIQRKKSGQLDYSEFINTGDWNLRRIYSDIQNTGIRPYLCALEHVYYFDCEPILKNINIPVLIIAGKKDTITPCSTAAEMSAKLQNSKIILIENGNHMLILNQKNQLINTIEKFLVSQN